MTTSSTLDDVAKLSVLYPSSSAWKVVDEPSAGMLSSKLDAVFLKPARMSFILYAAYTRPSLPCISSSAAIVIVTQEERSWVHWRSGMIMTLTMKLI